MTVSDIKRGDIYWVDWARGKGSEQAGKRPALVIQNNIGNRTSPNVIIASITTASKKAFPFLVQITKKESGLNKDSAVDLASIITISKQRLENRCGRLGTTKMSEVDQAIKVSLGLT